MQRHERISAMNNQDCDCELQIGDEDDVTDITIAADGRLFIFGASRPLLEMLDDLGMRGLALPDRAAIPATPSHR